jgi:hypothetical protein
MDDSIDIPETPPNGRATISVEFDARDDEDIIVSTWIIVMMKKRLASRITPGR